jgi:hypothetical protein
MSHKQEFETPLAARRRELEELGVDAEMEKILGDLRSSVHAWSDAAYSRPRRISAAEGRLWRRALGWALGCLLVAGGVFGGVYAHQKESAPLATAHAVTPQPVRIQGAPVVNTVVTPVAEQQADRDADALMAKVDSDVSRQVPAAMEPLAQLLAEDESE